KLLFGSHLSLYISVLVWLVLTSWNPIFYRDEVLKLMGVYLLAGIGYGYLIFMWGFYIYKKTFIKKLVKVLFRVSILVMHSLLIFFLIPLILSIEYYESTKSFDFMKESYIKNGELENLLILKDAYSGVGFKEDINVKFIRMKEELFLKRNNINFINRDLSIIINDYGVRKGFITENENHIMRTVSDYVERTVTTLDQTNNYKDFLSKNSSLMGVTLNDIYNNYINTVKYLKCEVNKKYMNKRFYHTTDKIYFKQNELTPCIWLNINAVIFYNFTVHYIDQLEFLYDKKLINSKYVDKEKQKIRIILRSLLQDKKTSVYALNHEKINSLLNHINQNKYTER
ncbi:MAG: hypothetical protein GY793_01925, partial [Proteobacteria bacterium]|nr:hypothetical protein [Pseudomonadota bacterium]